MEPLSERDIAILAINTSTEAYSTITEKDSLTLTKLRKAIEENKNTPNLVSNVEQVLILQGFVPLHKPKMVIEEYLRYCSLDSNSVDILAYRLLFVMKDPKAISLYRKTSNEKSVLKDIS